MEGKLQRSSTVHEEEFGEGGGIRQEEAGQEEGEEEGEVEEECFSSFPPS